MSSSAERKGNPWDHTPGTYTHAMGRGQATLRDQFSAIFGNRRGSGREDDLLSTYVLGGEVRIGNWKSVDPENTVLFVFPRAITSGSSRAESQRIYKVLESHWPGILRGVARPNPDNILVRGVDREHAPILMEVADHMASVLKMPKGAVVPHIPYRDDETGGIVAYPLDAGGA